MAITVKGIEIRADEANVETEFLFLTREGQERLFLENKELFFLDALNSQYSTVRRLLWEPEVLKDCSSKLLNQAVIQCLKGAPVGNIMDILNVPGFELEESIREILSCYGNLHLKIWVAEDAKTALHILKSDRMFMTAGKELVQSGNCLLFDAIVQNPNFKWDEEVEESMKYFSPEGKKRIKERYKFLKK